MFDNSLLDELTLEDLDEEQRELAECLGLDGYKNLITTYAGAYLCIRMPERICLDIRNRKICNDFNGKNFNELAIKYRLSTISIRKIIRENTPNSKT